METLLNRVFLVVSFPFHHFKYIVATPLLVFRVSAEIQLADLMGFPLYITCCFPLRLLIVSLSFIFAILIAVWYMITFQFILYFLDLDVCFLSWVREIF